MESEQRALGQYVHHTACRFCQSSNLIPFVDFGLVPLAGAFLTKDQTPGEKYYPLQVCFCRDCTLVQVNNAVPGETLFKNYFYFSSAIQTLVEHFKRFALEVKSRFLNDASSFVVEIGCNDGVLLKPLLAEGVKCLGVDPATNVVESSGLARPHILNDFFTEQVALQICKNHGPADAILSSFSFAHIDDMVDVMKGVKALLKDDGVLIFEVYYLGIVIDEMQYDMIYHEHQSYYSLVSLMNFMKRFGMEVFEVKRIPLRAGTIRFYVRNIGQRGIVDRSVEDLLAYERGRKLDDLSTYQDFGKKVESTKVELMALLSRLKKQRKMIIGYGASGRATTIMTYCGIDGQYLNYVVDDSPAKQGFLTPGTHVPIKPWSATEMPPTPDYVVVFAWPFIEEVKRRRRDYLEQGGRFIVPLPEVKVISA
jgi:SAM-dependent methyltransferase